MISVLKMQVFVSVIAVGVWNKKKGVVLKYLTESNSWIRKLSVLKEKGTLYAATDEGAIYTWKINETDVIFSGKVKENLNWVLALAAGEDGTIASGFKNGYFVFRTRFGVYHMYFRQPVVDIEMLTNDEFISFFVVVMDKGLYYIDLADKAFKYSSK
jgi:hypothetical protein